MLPTVQYVKGQCTNFYRDKFSKLLQSGLNRSQIHFGGGVFILLDHLVGLPDGAGYRVQLLYGHETWWMESSLDAEKSDGQFKVTWGHRRLIGLPLLYEHETW